MSRKNIFILFLVSLVGFGVGYILTNSILFNLCLHDEYSCRDLLNNIGDPLFYGMGALTLVFLILFFLPAAFSAWMKFAIWFIPLAVLIFITAPEPSGWVSPIPAPEQVFQWVSAFYILVSLLIIASISIFKKH